MLQRRFDSLSLIDTCELALGGLFESARECEAFMIRLRDFISSDDALSRIVNLRSDILGYDSEFFIPPRLDPMKPNLFFVVGNPAPQSVALRAMYAHEGGGDGRQHRFWKVMHQPVCCVFRSTNPMFISLTRRCSDSTPGVTSHPSMFISCHFLSAVSSRWPMGRCHRASATVQQAVSAHFIGRACGRVRPDRRKC
jgi:hypothetical protein